MDFLIMIGNGVCAIIGAVVLLSLIVFGFGFVVFSIKQKIGR